MHYAIISDVHGRYRKLKAVVAEAQSRGVDRFVSLGDIGGDDCLGLLRSLDAAVVFGNYEVSGWARLSDDHREWVRSWPPVLVTKHLVAVHAAPGWPRELHTIEDFGHWLRRTGRSWRTLFPYVTEDESCLWASLAELERLSKAILFHGHTHRQSVWRMAPNGRLQRGSLQRVRLKDRHRYVVGVGSVGLPEDGSWAAYTVFDSRAGCIDLVRVDRPQRTTAL
jgi:predicted phosphodiesterase